MDRFDIRLTGLAYGGEALGRLPDGRVIFVPFSLPGETIRVRIVEEKRGFARGELITVLEPSPKRVNPRCAHFGECGGCHYQHMPYEEQLEFKADILRDQLIRIGGLETPPVRPTVPSPAQWHYRNHMQFHLTPHGELGFHAARSDLVIPIRECHLPEGRINDLWPLLDIEPLPGLARVSLRTDVDGEDLLVLEGEDPEPPDFHVDLPLSAVYLGPEGPKTLAGSARLSMEVLGRSFQVSADSFFQVNTPLAGALVEHLLEHLPLSPGDTLVDAYCGVGLFSAFLAPRVALLIGIEAASSSCDDYEANLAEFDHVDLYQGLAEDVLPDLNVQPAAIVVDPPRSGLDRRALDGILALSPRTLAYVSCDPATLARDGRRLSRGGYHLEQVTPFDLFPQTYHIESVSIWKKGEGGGAKQAPPRN